MKIVNLSNYFIYISGVNYAHIIMHFRMIMLN